MGTQSNKSDFIRIRINPYQQKIALNMAFHMPGIIAGQGMRPILFGYRQLILQKFKNPKKFFNFTRIITETFVIFLILPRRFKFFHKPMDFSIA